MLTKKFKEDIKTQYNPLHFPNRLHSVFKELE